MGRSLKQHFKSKQRPNRMLPDDTFACLDGKGHILDSGHIITPANVVIKIDHDNDDFNEVLVRKAEKQITVMKQRTNVRGEITRVAECKFEVLHTFSVAEREILKSL